MILQNILISTILLMDDVLSDFLNAPLEPENTDSQTLLDLLKGFARKSACCSTN